MKAESDEIKLRRKFVGDFLYARRMDQGLTQQEVAKTLRYTSPQFISNWERGLALPPTDALQTIVKLYRIEPKELVNAIFGFQSSVMEKQKLELTKLFKKKVAERKPAKRGKVVAKVAGKKARA